MKNLIKEIFENANRIDSKTNYNNTNRIIKDLNRAISNGVVKINIQKKGEVWTNKRIDNGNFKFNIEVFSAGYVQRFYAGNITPEMLLNCVAKLLQQHPVREEIINVVNGKSICLKCKGKGKREKFSKRADGVCFDCMGTGIYFIKATGLKLV